MLSLQSLRQKSEIFATSLYAREAFHCYINRYSANVRSAVFLSSAQSPAIKSSKRITIRSPVSKFFGSNRRRKSPAPVFC